MLQQKCNLQQNPQSSLPLSCSQTHCLVSAWLHRMPQLKFTKARETEYELPSRWGAIGGINMSCQGSWGAFTWITACPFCKFPVEHLSSWKKKDSNKDYLTSPFSWIHFNQWVASVCCCPALSTPQTMNSLALTASAGFLVSRREAN